MSTNAIVPTSSAVFRETPASFHAVTSILIACTLSTAEKAGRGDEWRRFLDTNVVEVARSRTGVRLRLVDGDDVMMSAIDLARREKACCAFFAFSLELLADQIWLLIEAPADAADLLDELIAKE